jgi:hypothetical protein
MTEIPDDTATLLKLLANTPRRIASASKGLQARRLQFKPDDETWSVNDILAHLRASADVWGKSIQAMISQDHPTLRYVSPRTYIRKKNYPELDFHTSFESYTQQRADLIKTLKALQAEDWSRGATFTGTTSGREGTIRSYAKRIIQHELEHCEQIEALLK